MNTVKNVKIGRNKNHARILIENQVFAQYGWHPEQPIAIAYDHASQSIVITKSDGDSPNKLGGRIRGARQITRIELGDTKLTEFVGACTTATIEYAADSLRFVIGATV